MAAKRMTKAQVIADIAEFSELDKKAVSRVFDGLTELIKKELRKPEGEFVIPGLLKLRAVKKPARPALLDAAPTLYARFGDAPWALIALLLANLAVWRRATGLGPSTP